MLAIKENLISRFHPKQYTLFVQVDMKGLFCVPIQSSRTFITSKPVLFVNCILKCRLAAPV